MRPKKGRSPLASLADCCDAAADRACDQTETDRKRKHQFDRADVRLQAFPETLDFSDQCGVCFGHFHGDVALRFVNDFLCVVGLHFDRAQCLIQFNLHAHVNLLCVVGVPERRCAPAGQGRSFGIAVARAPGSRFANANWGDRRSLTRASGQPSHRNDTRHFTLSLFLILSQPVPPPPFFRSSDRRP